MEVFIVRLHKALLAALFAGVIGAGAQAQQAETPKLAQYYGFKDMEMIKLDWGVGSLRVADFNGDGRNDMAIVNNRKARIELLIQKKAIGPGETQVAVDPNDIDVNAIVAPTRFDAQSIPVSQRLYNLVCGDLNGDGRPDLAFYGQPRGLYVILQKAPEAGAGHSKLLSWHTREKIKIDDGLPTPDALECADLNHDGRDDLVLAARDGVYFIEQKKDGSLAEPVKYPASAQILGVEVGDLNGDSINDLVLVTNDAEKPLHVRFGLKTGSLGPQQRFFIEKPAALILHDIDGGPGDEILTVDAVSGRLICYKFAAEKRPEADWPVLFYPLASGQDSAKRDLVLGDFDGDGLTDVAISDPGAAELIFYRQTVGLGLAEPARFPAFADIASLSAADVDGDGKSELGVLSIKEKVIGLSRFKNDRLSFPQPLDVTGEPLAMELADIDGDGNADCVYVSKSNDTRTLRAILNVGAAQNKPTDSQKTVLAVLKKLSADPDGLKVLDVDQDGLQDVLIFVSYESPILVRQVEKGKFEVIDSSEAQASLIKEANLRSIALANVDGKPGQELLVAQKNFARSLVFSKGRTWSVIDQYNAKSTENNVSAVAAFDIDHRVEGVPPSNRGQDARDTSPAILLLDGQKGQLQILKAGKDKTYRLEKELDVGTWSSAAHLKMLLAPLTGGRAESLLLFDGEKFALLTPPGAGQTTKALEQLFSYQTKIKDGLYGNLTAGDINSDGRTDIIMVEYRNDHIEILTLDAAGKPVPAMRFKIFEQKSYRESQTRPKAVVEPRELTVADVTGDGKDDLITVIHDRIIIYPQD
jgi:FG-GAP-like repeat